MKDGRPIWTHAEHMAWGDRCLWHGAVLGFWLGALAALLVWWLAGRPG